MKSSKINKYFRPEIVEIDINENLLFPNRQASISTSASVSRTKKSNLFHKKLNSATNQNNHYSNSQHNLYNKDNGQRIKTIQTPEINTINKMRLDKLNNSISSLKNKYLDLLKQNFNDKKEIKNYQMRFIELKKKDDQ